MQGYDADDLVERMEHRFGLGDRPLIRKALYERVGAIVEAEGHMAYHVLATCASDAERSKGDKGRYFAWLLVRRFIERGFLKADEL